jgi:predicted nucleic acid-binding protein
MNEAKREFIDTNILVYAYNSAAGGKQVKAQTLLTDLWNSGNGCLSVQVFQEFYTVVTRKISEPLATENAVLIIEDLANWDYHVPDVDDILAAIKIQQRNNLSFWDALIIHSAKKMKCKIIWSEDLNNGRFYDGIKVSNPFVD